MNLHITQIPLETLDGNIHLCPRGRQCLEARLHITINYTNPTESGHEQKRLIGGKIEGEGVGGGDEGHRGVAG